MSQSEVGRLDLLGATLEVIVVDRHARYAVHANSCDRVVKSSAAYGIIDGRQPAITRARQCINPIIKLVLQRFADGASTDQVFLSVDLGTIDHVCQGGIMLRALPEDDLTKFEPSCLPWILLFSY